MKELETKSETLYYIHGEIKKNLIDPVIFYIRLRYYFDLLTPGTIKLSQLAINEGVLVHCNFVTNTYQHAKDF